MDELSGREESVKVTFSDGKEIEGILETKNGGYALRIEDRGVVGQVAVEFEKVALNQVVRWARNGGVDLEKQPVAYGVFLAARGNWEDALAEISNAGKSADRTEWGERLARVAPGPFELVSREEMERAAAKVYEALITAFDKENWKEVIKRTEEILKEHGDTDVVARHKQAILEMRAEAARRTGGEQTDAFRKMEKTFDFEEPTDRLEFFYSKFGGDIGNISFTRRGKAEVGSGKDSLLLFRRPVSGRVEISFEMSVEKRSELRIALMNRALGEGLHFTSEAFGRYGQLLTPYKRGGRKVSIVADENGITVTVDGRQEEQFEKAKDSNRFIAFYLIGPDVSIQDISIKAGMGEPVARLEDVFDKFDTISFAGIRKRDLRRLEE
ncbi:MAG: hypothetical protein U5N86_03010 [Planctomycetota bacterium]|nr:hypothetical protein [Planctomycetota bacterium]